MAEENQNSSCLGQIIVLSILYSLSTYLFENISIGKTIAFLFLGYVVYGVFKKWIDTFWYIGLIVVALIFLLF